MEKQQKDKMVRKNVTEAGRADGVRVQTAGFDVTVNGDRWLLTPK